MALGVLFLTYRFGKNIRSPDAGLWACLVLCANPGFYSMMRDARMDLTLTFFITLSIYGFYNYIYKGQNSINSPKERFVITEENEYNLLPQDYRNEMVVLGRFPYFPISRISYSFLNPKTREEVIKYIVLIGKKQYA